MNPSLLMTRRGAVAEIRLNRPGVHNAFDDALVSELTVAMQVLAADHSVRILLLTGAGPSFSAGADLGWMRRMAQADAAENREDALQLARLMRLLDAFPAPTIARVNGATFGGGVGLIACCDIAIAADSAKFALSEVKLGLVPAVISPYVIAAIGARQARRWFLTGEIFDAAQAQRIGLVHEVVPADGLDAAVERQCALLLKAGPQAVAEAKALVRRAVAAQQADALEAANAELIARLRVSPEGQEGLGAFLDKRKPGWLED